MDAATSKQVAALTHEDVVAVCSSMSGRHWRKVSEALADFGINGRLLSKHLQSAQALHSFLQQGLEIEGVKMLIVDQLRELVLSRAAKKVVTGNGGGGGLSLIHI